MAVKRLLSVAGYGELSRSVVVVEKVLQPQGTLVQDSYELVVSIFIKSIILTFLWKVHCSISLYRERKFLFIDLAFQ
jgi:hypothetical protein